MSDLYVNNACVSLATFSKLFVLIRLRERIHRVRHTPLLSRVNEWQIFFVQSERDLCVKRSVCEIQIFHFSIVRDEIRDILAMCAVVHGFVWIETIYIFLDKWKPIQRSCEDNNRFEPFMLYSFSVDAASSNSITHHANIVCKTGRRKLFAGYVSRLPTEAWASHGCWD